MASPESLYGGGAVAGHRLFDSPPRQHLTIAESVSLHLDVSVRALVRGELASGSTAS